MVTEHMCIFEADFRSSAFRSQDYPASGTKTSFSRNCSLVLRVARMLMVPERRLDPGNRATDGGGGGNATPVRILTPPEAKSGT